VDAPAWPLVDRIPPLAADEVHVWRFSLHVDDLAERLEPLLAADERERAGRFHFVRDRRRFVVVRGRLRMLLGEYLSTPPADVRLATTALGKPYLAVEPKSGLRFNLTHSDDESMLAVASGREIGVDVERERCDVEVGDLARRLFAPAEVAALDSLPEEERRPAFYRCWTRKEAYVKALGLGMQVPLNGFAVTLSADHAALTDTSHDPTQLRRWTLRGLLPVPGFAAAVAVEGGGWRLFCGRWTGFS
jgi:4'-phosphopantetheinyl transferase